MSAADTSLTVFGQVLDQSLPRLRQLKARGYERFLSRAIAALRERRGLVEERVRQCSIAHVSPRWQLWFCHASKDIAGTRKVGGTANSAGVASRDPLRR